MNKKKQKILFVFGTRPEAIKVAPLIKEFQKNPEKFDICVVSTGQHKEMLDQVVNFFQINIDSVSYTHLTLPTKRIV